MCRKLFLLTSFVVVLALVGSASAALPEGWQSQDIGTTDGSADESGGMWIIRADGADIWGSADEFHYAYVPLSGDGEIVAHVISNGEGSNGWAKGGVMIRETLDQGSKHAIMAMTGGEGGGIAFQGRPETDGSSWGLQGDITASLPQWVKLTREGNTITGYYSADGVEWTLMTDTSPDGDMTDPIDIEMAEDVYIGLFVTSHAAGEIRTYMFDNVELVISAPAVVLPQGWQSQDIGTTDGSVAESDGTWAISADGADIWGSSDQFRYAYLPLSGDGTIIAQVISNGEGSNGWAKGGVMIRETLDADSKHALMALTGGEGGGMGFQNRQETGGNSFSSHGDPTAAPPYWVKLTRVGNTITGYSSADGVDWVQQPDGTGGDMTTNPVDIEMAANIYIGLFVTSHASGEIRTYTFDNVGIELPKAPNIVWVAGTHDDNADGEPDDQAWVDLLEAQGLTVDFQRGIWEELDDWKIAALNAADLVIISRCSNSGSYDDDDEVAQWNSVTTPMINSSTHLIRSSRWRWLDTTSLPNLSDAIVDILVPDNPIFAGVESPAWVGDGLVGPITFADITGVGTGNGTLLAKVADTDVAWIVEWEAGVEFYPGSGEIATGPRMFFAAGTQEGTQETGELIGRGDLNLTPEGVTIFLNAVNSMLPAPPDVTAPGDIVKGVPDEPRDGSVAGWPDGEFPGLAVDDDTSTKFLHFKGELEPTGFQVTPAAGPSIVTGLTFTTANDAIERDPIAFELYGSNEGIDGPYELIASGDIVDFAQADAWPRFTKNETPISFENSVGYDHYQVLFPFVRDPASANSMQIAEVELLGELVPTSYVYDGDALDDTWDHDNGSDQWDGTAPGEGMPGGAVSLIDEDGVTFLRIQDTGDPRDYDMSDPGSNRKVYLTRLTYISLDGLRLEVRARVATTAPLDDMHPDGGAGIAPWPAEGIGYHIRDGGKGMFGVSDGVGIISFSLAQAGEPMFEDVTTDVLIMNSLVGTEPTSDVDTEDAAAAVALNMMVVDDATQWNTFVIDIVAGGAGTHVVSVSVNDGPAESFDVTLGSDLEADGPFITIGSSGTGGITAFDVDYLAVSKAAPVEIVNILANGGFEDGVAEPWSTYGDATIEVVQELVGAAVPDAPIEGSSCLHVVVAAAGANFWDSGLQHEGQGFFEAGKQYTLSAFLKCSQGTLDINFKPELAADPWTGYGSQAFTMTEEWAEYSVTTDVFTEDVSPASITFHIGYAAAEFWVDGVRFVEVE